MVLYKNKKMIKHTKASTLTSSKDRNDGVAYKMCEMIDTDAHILLISRQEELNFNENILGLKGVPYVIIDYIENGWDVNFDETLVIGKNTEKFNFLYGEGWKRLHDFVAAHSPILYFKRELLQKDVSDWLLPIEYPNWQPDYPLQLREQFNNRAIQVLNYWGRSHEARLMLHGEIWKNAARKGYTVCDNIYQFNHFMHHEKDNKNKWLSFHIPFYDRCDINEIMKINAISKLSISLFGCGRKCFRNTGESIVNSICVMPEDGLAYSYPFEHGVNCIKFSINDDITGLKNEWDVIGACEEALKRDDLYDIYLESKKAADWYRADNYLRYLSDLINNA